MRLWTETLRELTRPTRLVPILVLALPLAWAQHVLSHEQSTADGLSVLMIGGFLALGPYSWRRMVVPGGWTRLLWPAVGVLPFLAGWLTSQAVESHASYLLQSSTGWMTAGLFLVGSWGLGRDIELARGLDRMTEAARSAQILALQAHLDPHFLYNTLNAIAEWCIIDGARAERSILALADVLREMNEGIGHPRWPLGRELDLARKVLELHATRDPDRYAYDIRGACPTAEVPPLLLLPLIENAVTHGPAKGHAGRIDVHVVDGPEVVVAIRSPGPFHGPRQGGTGLATVRDRLRLMWGHRASLHIEAVDGGTLVSVRWPRA